MADFVSVTCLFPVFIIKRSTGFWSHLGQSGCSFFGLTQVFFSSFRYTAMFLLSFDRFNMVFFPFTYPLQGNKVMIPLTIVVWILPLLKAIIPLFIQCYGFELAHGFCTVSSGCSHVCLVYMQDRPGCCCIHVWSNCTRHILFSDVSEIQISKQDGCSIRHISRRVAKESQKYVHICYWLWLFGMFGTFHRRIASKAICSAAAVQQLSRVKCDAVIHSSPILDPLVIMKHQDVKQCALKPLQELKRRLKRLFPLHVHPGSRTPPYA